ncbi:3-isopropylmalate dehydrogenase [Pontibacter ummariensis]|uniref:3-isopropylmalate dehydrogenase n=1 Tax=Pontibacter ummariensis TaxID=1610492 RepID=A0A239FCW8_9BACT|nr:3-isopropylmalate dehydrogenase [Pontibacter ummariensis]PRY12345.1 3-isopropylmalate dehydrogenase [Pontibacter ummariensis]SNS53924.1 3-isopropylmalate dehydrogenase [Pontibacter ummariensis]
MGILTKHIAVLPGDGIGPEVCNEAVKVLKAISERFGHQFEFNTKLMGACAIDATGDPLPEDTLDACFDADAVLMGAIGDPKYDNNPGAKVRPEQGLLRLRKSLGLFANIRPVTAYDALLEHSPLKRDRVEGADMLIFRELTGGIYFGEKGRTEDSAYDHCTYSREEIERVAHLAFQAASARTGKLTLVDKANVLETSRLWREVVQEVAKGYEQVKVDYLFVDNAAMQLILNPKQFDVMLTENMFGDILSDEASVLAGSLGLLPSASVGERTALFEPIHGSYPQAKGKGIANPIASILSAAMLLEHFGLQQEASVVKDAVQNAIDHQILTPELNKESSYTTEQVGSYIAYCVLEGAEALPHKSNIEVGLSTII